MLIDGPNHQSTLTNHQSHDSLSTSAGSIRDARKAGSQPASAPTAARTAADPTSVAGSRGSSPYNKVATNVDAHTLTPAPTSTPTPTSSETRFSTSPTTPRGAAPRAIRIPISVRRLVTAYDVMPYRPRPASSSASAPKNPDNIAIIRSCMSEAPT